MNNLIIFRLEISISLFNIASLKQARRSGGEASSEAVNSIWWRCRELNPGPQRHF